MILSGVCPGATPGLPAHPSGAVGMKISIAVRKRTKEILMLLWIAIVIAVLWLLGLLTNIGGGLIHILLVVAVVVLIFHFLRGRSRV
jgi:4-hydroxybenzoate polyprenyltransferase